jgi:hypothetical protein
VILSSYGNQEIETTKQPIRPGIPGKSPFWNGNSTKFVYAPAFPFSEVPGADHYRFTVEDETGSKITFEAETPWASLTPIWDKLPQGKVHVQAEGCDSAGQSIRVSGERTFYRSPIFNGPYHDPAPIPLREAGKNGLRALYLQEKLQYWLREGKPDPKCRLYCYPAKEMGAAVRGMVTFSKLADNEQEAKDALRIACIIADFLISTSIPAGEPLEHLPLVYWVNPELPEIIEHVKVADRRKDKMMLSEPTRAAFGYLDLYDATNDVKYLDAALRIAAAYRKIQRADGTWPLIVDLASGAEIESKPVIPTWVLLLLDRLNKQYGITEFEPMKAQVERWILDHPVKHFHWDAQFEDIEIRAPYQKMSYEQASDTAWYLLHDQPENSENRRIADELLRFVEDQFIVWEMPVEGWKSLGLAGSAPGRYPTRLTEYWITPSVIEQYGFYPVSRATAVVMRSFGKAYEATGNEIYLAKALSLAGTLIRTQQHHGGGEIPTFPMTTENFYWTNNSVYNALYLLELDAMANSRQGRIPS